MDNSNERGQRRLTRSRWVLVAGVAVALAVTACAGVRAPVYRKPAAWEPSAFKEFPVDGSALASEWKTAQPRDDIQRGQWWEAFGDPALNALEEQVSISNQSVHQAEAEFRAARAAVRAARAGLFPTVTAGVFSTRSRVPGNQSTVQRSVGTDTLVDYQLPIDFSYEADVWGRVRNNVEASRAGEHARAADLQAMLLSTQAELAVDYFLLRGADAQRQLLDSTVAAYEQALQLTINLFNQGLASGTDVEQARTQLESTRAQATEVDVARAQYEHAIAILIGHAPADLTVPPAPLHGEPPPIPVALPSDLLERRPDVAAAERRVAAANAQIGVARSAYFPTLLLTAGAGFENATLTSLLTLPSRFWSLGPALMQTALDAGRRRAGVAEALANYDATVAAYRQTVLTACRDVEDQLAVLRVLADEAMQQAEAVASSERLLGLANNRYAAGVAAYLEVVTAQAATLANHRTAVNILTRRMIASALLIKGLGGGWHASETPR